MLCLYDARTRRVEEVLPATPGRLTLYAAGPPASRHADFAGLRACLVADLIRRTGEHHNLRVAGVRSVTGVDRLAGGDAGTGEPPAAGGRASDPAQRHAEAFDRDASALNVHPPQPHPRSVERVDIVVEPAPGHPAEWARPDELPGREVVHLWARVGSVLFDGRETAAGGSAGPFAGDVVTLSDVADRGLDPLALRLALLEHRYRTPLSLAWSDLHAAGETLARWRTQVAEWAESPSAAMPKAYVREVYDAFDDDLDTPEVLGTMRRLEKDETLGPGARFETFAHLDRLLGLDLARDVGKPR